MVDRKVTFSSLFGANPLIIELEQVKLVVEKVLTRNILGQPDTAIVAFIEYADKLE